ncbi:holin [Mycobacterium phage Benvolio]|uniref:Holin n=1 Tax=Mycobacterium phage Benvolio TaxID=2591074 RepID=A0A514A3H5_9CAUD|nr:holin [Mycobacterium phage Echild]YP_010063447.1 holin [Mycobacterium phage Benvolio]AHG24231.1 holin [Mycobacterium phage Echild]QDH47828.1 holin [Mycobacterium phage Benvolio]
MSPKVRQTIYYIGTLVPGILGIALIWGGIDAGAAENIGDIISGALALIGAGAPATAAVTVDKQRKDGTLSTDPVEIVVKSVEQVLEQKRAAEAAVQTVTQAVSGAVSDLQRAAEAVNLGPLASQILNGVGSALPPQAYSLYDPTTAWRKPEDR